jgi:hypothetical protein
MINLKFDEKAYQEYIRERDCPSNTRVRPEGVSFMDVITEGQKIMESTPEGKEILEYISRIGE